MSRFWAYFITDNGSFYAWSHLDIDDLFMSIQHFGTLCRKWRAQNENWCQKLSCRVWNFIVQFVMKGRAVTHFFFVKVINSNYVHQLNETEESNRANCLCLSDFNYDSLLICVRAAACVWWCVVIAKYFPFCNAIVRIISSAVFKYSFVINFHKIHRRGRTNIS